MGLTLEFHRLRFWFEVIEPLAFPPGESGNLTRGALGSALHKIAGAATYRRLFEPGGGGTQPSGLRDWPRPFVLRTAHLDGRSWTSGEHFFIDFHFFPKDAGGWTHFRDAFRGRESAGLALAGGCARLLAVEELDLGDTAHLIDESLGPACSLALDRPGYATQRVRLRFVTPTELKSGGQIVDRPEFPVLFARLRDRIATLQSLYGHGSPDIDYRALAERAAAVRLTACDIRMEYGVRKSGRTGRTHPLAGFTGDVEYEGELTEFIPWLQAARWVGVGRQTVWGKGEVRLIEPMAEAGIPQPAPSPSRDA